MKSCKTVGATSDFPDDALAVDPSLEDRPFAALADAFFEDGLFLQCKAGSQIREPFNAIFVSTRAEAAQDEEPFASHPRLWVQAGAQSRLEVREIYLAVGAGKHLTNVCSQYRAGDGADLTRTSIQADSASATFLSSVALRADRDARVANRAFSLGAKLTREDLVCELAGVGAHCELRGLYLTRDGQHSDHHTRVEHRVPLCGSRQLYGGVLAGHSRAGFTG